MPTANSAASRKPTQDLVSRFRRPALLALGVLAGLSANMSAATAGAPAVAAAGPANTCSGWSSTSSPPSYIRVLRRQSGRVERVPFRRYVLTVMGKEWPGYLPQPVIEAGAVAVKQYAWFHSLGRGRMTSRGQCFDVTDGVGDQLYKPNRSRVRSDHYTALAAVWNLHLVKDGRLFMTGYRTGNKGRCGHDATGWKLFARSATRCAYSGLGFEQILRTYYGPNLRIVRDGSGSAVSVQSTPPSSAPNQSAGKPAGTTKSGTKPTSTPGPADPAPAQAEALASQIGDGEQGAPPPTLLAKLAEFDGPATIATPDEGVSQLSELESSQVIWRGSWQRARSAIGSGESLVYSGREGSNATFQFTGRSIELIGQRGPDQGWLEVYIDGRLEARIDAASDTVDEPGALYSGQWPAAAPHTVQLVVIGSPARPRVDIDQVVIGS